MRVTTLRGFQTSLDGVTITWLDAGVTLDVDEDTAARWLAKGAANPVDADPVAEAAVQEKALPAAAENKDLGAAPAAKRTPRKPRAAGKSG